MLHTIRTLAASLAAIPLIAAAAPAQGGTTPLDRALAAQDGAPLERRVEARRAVEDALMDSTLYFVRLPGAEQGSRFLVGRQGDLPALSGFDTPERLLRWAEANFTEEQREPMGEFSGPAGGFLVLLDRQMDGEAVLYINASYDQPLVIDPVFLRFLAARARQARQDLPLAQGEPAPATPLERHAHARAQAAGTVEVAPEDLRYLVDGQLFYVPLYDQANAGNVQSLPQAENAVSGGDRLALEGETRPDGSQVFRLAVFDRRALADGYARAFEAQHDTVLRYRVMRGIDLMQALPANIPVAINPGSPYMLVIAPDGASADGATD